MGSLTYIAGNLIRRTRRWLSIGIGVKRWLVVLVVGAAIGGMAAVYVLVLLQRSALIPTSVYRAVTLQFLSPAVRIFVLTLVGAGISALALIQLGRALLEPFRRPDEALADSLYLHKQRARGPHIVAIGGGSGLPSLLRGLTSYTSNITTIVTMADDGGSSGRLRRELGLLPPGDLRNNMAALARDEALMSRLLQYRFGDNLEGEGTSELRGHAFGNLLLAALTGITGSFDDALLAAERVLALQGRVLPSTLAQVTLYADKLVGQPPVLKQIVGESKIPHVEGPVQRVYLEPAGAPAYPPAVQAIFRADLIVLGPGSLYTSIVPNLLVQDLANALRHARAPIVYICNLATQPGETDNYSVADHVAAIANYLPANCLDYVLANDNMRRPLVPGAGRTDQYVPNIPPPNVRTVTDDLIDNERPWRHDSNKLARAVMSILDSHG